MKIFVALTNFQFLHQNAAPKKPPPKDWWDHFKEDPYSIQEVEKGKVWKVAYTMENFFALEYVLIFN